MPELQFLTQQALNRAVREAVEYVHADGWDQSPALFGLVPTATLSDALNPELLDPEALDNEPLTVIAQEPLPEGIDGGSPELSDFIARTFWPAGVVGCVLAQEILIISPDDADSFADASLAEIRAHAGSNGARQARLFTGVLDDGPSLTLIQVRPTEAELEERGPFAEDDIELRDGTGLAEGVTSALYGTFENK